MREFIFKASSTKELNIIVARDTCKKDFVCARIDCNEHVYVASGDRRDIAKSINTTDVNVERIARNVYIGSIGFCDFGFNSDGV